ncbi:MAG: iron ABC transporter permease [Chloroflexi bacterium]|nr:iron ABC transporter permease [Chloroflexota bacterium]
MRSITREPSVVFVLLILIALMGMFIVYPQIQVVLVPGLDGYFNFLAGETWIKPLFNSIQIMLLSTTTAVLLGFIYAYAMVYSDMRWKPFFRIVGLLPLLSPPFVVAAAYLLIFSLASRMLGQRINVLGIGGLWIVQTIAFFPFAYQLIADVLSRSDPRLEQAARNLGASAWNVFRTITLPLARPGLAAATLTTAIYIVEDFGNPILLLGKETVLATQAYSLISGFGDFTGAAVVSTILLALALALYVARLRLEGNKSYVTISGKATSIPRPPVPRAVSNACFVACLLLAIMILLVYGVLIISAFVQAFPFNMTPTWKNFEYIGEHSLPLRNTLAFGGTAAIICALFGLVLAFFVQRKQWFGRGVIDFIAIMPAAVPGIFWGIGYATAFNQKWFEAIAYPLFGREGTPGMLIIVALLFWNIPIGYQAVMAGLQQIDRSLDEAATSLGASTLRGFRDILAPMLGSALLTGFVTAFVRAVTTLSVVIFLFTPGTTVATITIFQKVNDADWGGAAAYTILVIGMAVLVLSAVYFISGRRAGLQKAPGG